MRKQLTALMFAGLLVFGVAACDDDADTGTDLDAPADTNVDPAAPADDPLMEDPAMDDPALGDPAIEPTE